ncbi:MAG: TIGR03757 family integrating conjugative element protein [Hydrogenophaga sp.]
MATLAVLSVHPAGSASAQSVTRIEVFANSAMVITPEHAQNSQQYQVVIYRLDALKQVEAQINRNVPKTDAAAREYFARNEAQLKRAISPSVINAANGITLVNHYRIERIPAIVLDGKSVIYGVTDINQALALYQRSQGGRP